MEVLVNSISEIVDDKLSMSQRGLLITILLLRKHESKVALAILKAKVKLNDFKEDLIFLHENNFIKWSEYNKAKNSLEEKEISPDVMEAVSFMNSLYGRKFDINSQSTTKNLTARIKQYGLEKVKKVIANRWDEWKDNEKMKKYLKPSTIFRSSKFDKYLEEVLSTGRGLKYVEADSISLKTGTIIDSDNVKTLRGGEVYNITVYPAFEESNINAIGISKKFYGTDLRTLVKLEERKRKKEFIYKFGEQ